MFFKFSFNQCQRELGSIHWKVQLGQYPGKRADVVFVSMGEKDGANFVAIFKKVGDVGDDDIDSEQLRFGKHQAGVDDDDVVAPAQRHTVHAELA